MERMADEYSRMAPESEEITPEMEEKAAEALEQLAELGYDPEDVIRGVKAARRKHPDREPTTEEVEDAIAHARELRQVVLGGSIELMEEWLQELRIRRDGPEGHFWTVLDGAKRELARLEQEDERRSRGDAPGTPEG